MNRNVLPLRQAFLCLSLIILCASSLEAQSNKLRIPADWEPHDALWIGFRTMLVLDQFDPVTLEVIRQVQDHTPIKLMVESSLFFTEGRQYLADNGIKLDRTEVIYQSPAEFWLRDPGPIFAKNEKEELVTLDFLYSGRQDLQLKQIQSNVIQKGTIDKTLGGMVTPKSKKINIVMEGGAIHTNGSGTFLLVEAVTLKRNPGLSKEDIEKRLSNAVQVHDIIWLKQGLAEDPMRRTKIVDEYYGSATGGHVDEFVRFVNDSTILLSWIPEKDTSLHPIYAMNYQRLNDAYQRLKQARTINGKPYTITRIPHPDLFYEEIELGPEHFSNNSDSFPGTKLGDTIKYVAAASYMNYLITNDLIILPKYWMPGLSQEQQKKDEQVYNIFHFYFPNHKIVRINPLQLNFRGGGIHCIYQEQPAVSPVHPVGVFSR